MSELLARGTEVLDVEPFAGFDDKGRASYNAPRVVYASVVREVKVRALPDGTHERTTLTVHLDASEEYHPDRDDRFAYGDDLRYYVVREVNKPKRLDGEVHHVRLLCREA